MYIFIVADSINQEEDDCLKFVKLVKDEENRYNWILEKVRNYEISTDTDFRRRLNSSCILIGRTPKDSINNQKIKIGDREYLLKYDEEQTVQNGDYKEDSVIAIRFNPEVNQDYLYIENISINYYLRKFSDISNRIEQDISDLNSLLNSKVTEINSNISLVRSDLLNKIDSASEDLLVEINKVSERLNHLIDNKIELKGASINGDLSVTGVVDLTELIFPTVSGSHTGAVWLKSL